MINALHGINSLLIKYNHKIFFIVFWLQKYLTLLRGEIFFRIDQNNQ